MRLVHTLTKHKISLTLAILLAVAAAIMTVYRVGPEGLESRSTSIGAATVQVLVDSPQSALANLKQSTVPLTTRAGVFAEFMASNAVRESVAASVGIRSDQIVARGPYDDPAAAPQGATVPDPSTGVPGSKPYKLTFVAQEELPIVTVYAEAPDERGAKLLADGVVTGVKQYVDKLQNEAALPPAQRVVIRGLGPATAGTVVSGTGAPMIAAAFIFVFGFCCFLILVMSGVRERARGREAVEMPAEPIPAPVPLKSGGWNQSPNNHTSAAASVGRSDSH